MTVAIQAAAYPMDTVYTYQLTPEQAKVCQAGCRVVVPFGRGNRLRVGMAMRVFSFAETPPQGLKYVLCVADRQPVLNAEQLQIAEWMRENMFCSQYEAVRTMLPAAFQLQMRRQAKLNVRADVSGLSSPARNLLNFLEHACTPLELDALLKDTTEKQPYVQELLNAGILRILADTESKKVKMVRLKGALTQCRLTPKQLRICKTLQELGTMTEKELCYVCAATTDVLRRLEQNGMIERYSAEPKDSLPEVSPEPLPVLSPEQQSVYDRVVPFLSDNKPKCFLLHGVTGSGKTAVFGHLIARTLELDRTVLLLLPEIALTPQTVRRFAARFGDCIAVVHSGLSVTERKTSYERARRGEARLVIGTRSAIFTPLPDIGLIIMDEEGERSYKSESAPRYDTIQIARYRCKYHGAVLLPSSATPTLESYFYAQKGIYELLTMRHRYNSTPLPAVEMVDMTIERQNGNDSEFSRCLQEALQSNLEKGEQSILLLNRRGYHTIISCCTCNQPVYCDHCSIPMTWHKPDSNLHCHYCGAVKPMPETCPVCGSAHLRRMGFGTQRMEDELAKLFPTARLLRMDADTTASRHAYEERFEAFRRQEYDIMLGTQMIGKGLDFPNVTLVGVVNVDKALFSGDFRSYERTFSLITQVVGRGGRGGKSGRAILQTFQPEHYVLRLAAAQDYEGFAREEFAIRKALLFPPFCDVCILGIQGEMEKDVQNAAQILSDSIQKILTELPQKLPLRILGPVPCGYYKISGKYRWRIIIKCKNNAAFRQFLECALKEAYSRPGLGRVHIYADLNGNTG